MSISQKPFRRCKVRSGCIMICIVATVICISVSYLTIRVLDAYSNLLTVELQLSDSDMSAIHDVISNNAETCLVKLDSRVNAWVLLGKQYLDNDTKKIEGRHVFSYRNMYNNRIYRARIMLIGRNLSINVSKDI